MVHFKERRGLSEANDLIDLYMSAHFSEFRVACLPSSDGRNQEREKKCERRASDPEQRFEGRRNNIYLCKCMQVSYISREFEQANIAVNDV